MTTVTIQEAQAHLPELIAGLQPEEELLICRDGEPVAKLVGEMPARRVRREAGRQKDEILYIADDFNAPLDDFKEYMP